jgi:YHS domain-containing protein
MALARLIIGFFWFLVALLGVRLLSRWLGRHFGQRPPEAKRPRNPVATPELRGAMVKDPVCGTWVDPGIALALPSGGETIHFCSEECRRVFSAQHPTQST